MDSLPYFTFAPFSGAQATHHLTVPCSTCVSHIWVRCLLPPTYFCSNTAAVWSSTLLSQAAFAAVLCAITALCSALLSSFDMETGQSFTCQSRRQPLPWYTLIASSAYWHNARATLLQLAQTSLTDADTEYSFSYTPRHPGLID